MCVDIREFHIIIVEQSNDGRKFNRGKLLNIGYKLGELLGDRVNKPREKVCVLTPRSWFLRV